MTSAAAAAAAAAARGTKLPTDKVTPGANARSSPCSRPSMPRKRVYHAIILNNVSFSGGLQQKVGDIVMSCMYKRILPPSYLKDFFLKELCAAVYKGALF